ncbi:MAG TPA: hypothetical protein EYH50_00950 [Pyrodictium delaneyi]|uniref:Uncharacterized protein n=1 Tax=Pyrodictium delaneyi TaxID=1273541 RepID=A0A832ZTR2_9CREN|nr:hypothetical protein [Pyrodictium delaneyi]
MTLRLRTHLLGLCGQLEALRVNLERYRDRYSAKLSSINPSKDPGAERLRTIISSILENIDGVARAVDNISNLVCSDEPSIASIVKAYHIADKTYYRLIIGRDAPIPASVRSAFYEIYRTLKLMAV